MTSSVRIRRAICRGIPDSFDRAVVQVRPAQPIDVLLARVQHQAYVQALESLGVQVVVLPAVLEFPDCCFVEDCAVHAEGVALMTRPGVPSRRGEEQAVAEALRLDARLESTGPPATLEGGDCMRLGKRWYVGRSQRTNAEGVRRFRQVFEPIGFEIIEVQLGRVLHLKCVCSPLGDEALLLADGTIPAEVFRDVQIIPVPAAEEYAANCLYVNGTILMPAGFPVTRGALETAGFQVLELDTSEFRKAEGALTCLSVLW